MKFLNPVISTSKFTRIPAHLLRKDNLHRRRKQILFLQHLTHLFEIRALRVFRYRRLVLVPVCMLVATIPRDLRGALRLEHDEDRRIAFRFALQVVAQRAWLIRFDGLRCLLEEFLDLGGGC